MMNKKLVANIAVNIILLIIYIYCFGQHSVSKYLADGVIVVKYEEVSTNISPPGKSDIPMNKKLRIIKIIKTIKTIRN